MVLTRKSIWLQQRCTSLADFEMSQLLSMQLQFPFNSTNRRALSWLGKWRPKLLILEDKATLRSHFSSLASFKSLYMYIQGQNSSLLLIHPHRWHCSRNALGDSHKVGRSCPKVMRNYRDGVIYVFFCGAESFRGLQLELPEPESQTTETWYSRWCEQITL